jgi:galactose-1-phosphate uridylyltransferase
MKEKVRFERHLQKSTFHNPMLGNSLDTQELEIRRDPLMGYQSVFNPRLEDKVAVVFGPSDPALIERLARESEPRCFLCGDKWKHFTPSYPDDLVPGGRIQIGEAILFPNLFPLSQVHAVIRVGASHYLPLKDFDASIVLDAFRVSSAFAKTIFRTMSEVRFLTVNANYLGPAGASIAHPHFQVVGGDLPFTYLEHLLARSKDHFQKHGSSYWVDLVESEKESGDRFIGQTGPVAWITTFSPQGTNEVLGILTKRRDFLEMDEEDMQGLAEGFSLVLKGYDSMGMSTFNFAIYSGPLGGEDNAFRCYFRIISRQNVYENYRTDDSFIQKLLRNEMVLVRPEALASTMREVFSSRKKFDR